MRADAVAAAMLPVTPRADLQGPAAVRGMLPSGSWTVWLHIETRAGMAEHFAPEQIDRGETFLITT